MSLKKVVMDFLIVILGITMGSGCGPAQPIQMANSSETQAHSESEGFAQKLGVSVFRQKASPSSLGLVNFFSPDVNQKSEFQSEYNVDVNYQGNQIIYKKIFQINKEEALFVTWPGVLNGLAIVQVRVHWRILNGNNQWFSLVRGVGARYQKETSRWFVSLTEILQTEAKSSPENLASKIREENTQSIVLELHFSNYSVEEVELKFMAVLCQN